MAKDFYSVLGVAKSADADEIKRAYKKLATKLHPDRNPGKPEIESRFKEVNGAYGVLSDAKKRALYDEFGEEGLREGFDPVKTRAYNQYRQGVGVGGGGGDPFGGAQGVDLGDLFGDMFGRQRAAARGPRKGGDLEGEVTIDFASSLRGTTVEMAKGNETFTVRIPAGAQNGSRIRAAGQGSRGPNGGPPGDLLLLVHVTEHPHFWREGDDLHLDLPVTVGEAFEGAKVRVPTIDGSVTAKLPVHSQSGQQVRLKGKGVARKGRPPGDLYVHLAILIPTDDGSGEAIRALERHYKGDVRAGIAL